MKRNNIVIKFLIVFVLMVSIIGINVNAETNEAVAISEIEDVTTLTETMQVGIFDVESSESTYKYSDSKDIYLPFIRCAVDRILIDRELDGFGTSFSAQSIEVNSDIKGVQVLFAGDSIRVNNKMEYGVLFATTNAIVSSEVDGSLIIFAGEKVTVSEEAVIKGDIICFGTDIEINGTVEGSVVGAATNVVVNGSINKDLRVEAANVTLGENLVKGNVYVETYNSSLVLPESYANAKINLLTAAEEVGFDFSIIYTAIITAAVFTLVYFIFNKVTKNKGLENGLNKIKSNWIVVVFGGAIALMIIPAVFVVLTLLSIFGLYMIAIPMMIVYFTFLLVVGLLSTLIIGTLITEYMANSKYLKDKGIKTKYLFAFLMFAILYILARVPYIGGYVALILVMFAIGSVICMLFCKNKNEIIDNKIVEEE